jgi:hypothetical protein
MKARVAWVISRTVGLMLLTAFGAAYQPAKAAAHCQGCRTTCVPNPDKTQTCSSTCIEVGTGAAGCNPNPDGKGCSFSGYCSS